MPGVSPPSMRLVIQYVVEHGGRAYYQVIAYPAPLRSKPAQFATRGELLQRLREVLPGAEQRLPIPEGEFTQVVLAENVELSATELACLGIKEG
ncbi:MAG TPA: hypothetical protein VFA89_09820 [Terriglobales bacterium]|nr:hypothetical protein [Terriglobales bacterium]